jgi:hypothetical protein
MRGREGSNGPAPDRPLLLSAGRRWQRLRRRRPRHRFERHRNVHAAMMAAVTLKATEGTRLARADWQMSHDCSAATSKCQFGFGPEFAGAARRALIGLAASLVATLVQPLPAEAHHEALFGPQSAATFSSDTFPARRTPAPKTCSSACATAMT